MDREEKRKHLELVRIAKDYAFCGISIVLVTVIGIIAKSASPEINYMDGVVEHTELLVEENAYDENESIVKNQSNSEDAIVIKNLTYRPEESVVYKNLNDGAKEDAEKKEVIERQYSYEYTDYGYEVNDNVPLEDEVQKHIQALCEEYEVPYEIVLGVIETESTFRDWVVAGNCHGLMMIHSCNFRWLERELGITDFLDPVQNAHAGIYILKMFYEKYGDWNKVLVCYNCGEAGAEKNVFQYGYTSTKYSEKCLKLADKWKEILSNT